MHKIQKEYLEVHYGRSLRDLKSIVSLVLEQLQKR